MLMTDYPAELEPPGIKPIKQAELFKKWRQFVPVQFQNEICPNPGTELLNAVAKEKSEKRKNRANNIVLASRPLEMNNN